MEPRVGARMRAVVRYVGEHPGCSKRDAALATGLQSAGYEAVNRALDAGLLWARRWHGDGNRIALFPRKIDDLLP